MNAPRQPPQPDTLAIVVGPEHIDGLLATESVQSTGRVRVEVESGAHRHYPTVCPEAGTHPQEIDP